MMRFIFRFVNIILKSGLEKKKLLDIIKKYRSKYLIDNINILKSKMICFNSATEVLYAVLSSNYAVSDIDFAVNFIDKELEKFGSKHIHYKTNVLYKFETGEYEAAAELFIYLTICPKYMFDWTTLYTKLLQKSTPDVIVQTLNRIMKAAKMKGDKTNEILAMKTFRAITDRLFLNYPKIDQFTKGIPKNSNELSQNSSKEFFLKRGDKASGNLRLTVLLCIRIN